jgi:hypothetical protein
MLLPHDTDMSHLAVVEALDGRMMDWMEKVSHEQYGATSKPG